MDAAVMAAALSCPIPIHKDAIAATIAGCLPNLSHVRVLYPLGGFMSTQANEDGFFMLLIYE